MDIRIACRLHEPKWFIMDRAVYSPDGLSPTIHTQAGGNTKVKVLVEREDA